MERARAPENSLRGTLIDLSCHFASAAALFFLFGASGGLAGGMGAVIGAVFIDADHFGDYFLFYGRNFSFRNFFYHQYLDSGKCYIIFHSWELVLILAVLSVRFVFLTPLATGAATHLLIDYVLSHRRSPMFLFLLYRWKNGFKLEKTKKYLYSGK